MVVEPRQRFVERTLHVVGFTAILVSAPEDVDLFGDWVPRDPVVVTIPLDVTLTVIRHRLPRRNTE